LLFLGKVKAAVFENVYLKWVDTFDF